MRKRDRWGIAHLRMARVYLGTNALQRKQDGGGCQPPRSRSGRGRSAHDRRPPIFSKKEGMDHREAFERIMLILEYFEKQDLSEVTDETDADEASFQRLGERRGRFLAMIR